LTQRSTIAIPLRDAIEQELAETEEFLKQYPDVLKEHNAAVFHREDFPGGLDEARRVALERLAEAVKEINEERPQRIDPYDPNTKLPKSISLAQSVCKKLYAKRESQSGAVGSEVVAAFDCGGLRRVANDNLRSG
jgi:hypothetical protein